MAAESQVPIQGNNKGSSRRVSRRQWIERMLSGVAGGLAASGLAASHPVRKHLLSASTLDLADAQAAALDWKPLFLNAHQAETVAVLAERIVPGSTLAQSGRFIDLLLSVDIPQNQHRFLASLAAMDGESKKQHGHDFKDLSEDEQNGILTIASTAESGYEGKDGKSHRRKSAASDGVGEANKDTLRDHFENLKGWLVGAYYSSEAGMKELGWTGQVMFESFPGCEHPGGHA